MDRPASFPANIKPTSCVPRRRQRFRLPRTPAAIPTGGIRATSDNAAPSIIHLTRADSAVRFCQKLIALFSRSEQLLETMDATQGNISFPLRSARMSPEAASSAGCASSLSRISAQPRKRKRPISRLTRGLREPISAQEAHAISRNPAGRRCLALAPFYSDMVEDLRNRYKISIRKWRSDMAGVAYELTYRDGRIKRLIASPPPRSPVSAAIFLHEIGHHAIGFRRYAQRCLEEHYVWQWAFREMHARGIPVTRRVLRHYRRSMSHYITSAHARGEHVPPELSHHAHAPAEA